jgi:hypothetical protein
MLERTRKKIRQAEFFLHRLTAEQEGVIHPDPESSDFYLSAFLSAARSITLTLGEEQPVEYGEWLPGWYLGLSENDRKLLTFCINQFDLSQTGDVIDIGGTDMSLSVGQILQDFDTQETLIFIESEKMKSSRGCEVTVLSVCREYLDLLKTLVAEFEHVNLMESADDGHTPARPARMRLR